MIYSVHQPQYLPWLGFFDKIDRSDCFVFLDDVQYKHREFQNRNKIRTKDGWIWLSVPVRSSRGEKIRDVRIDNSRDWCSDHLKSMRSWYARAEFFDTYFPLLENILLKPREKLAELNISLVEFFLKSLGIQKQIYFESALEAGGTKTERIINIGKKIGADVYLSGAGGKDYLEEPQFSEAHIELRFQEFSHPVYRQQFVKSREDFISYLSAVDALFNEGGRTLGILRSAAI